MVAIPQATDPTLTAMLKIIADRPRDKRGYLGASLIGEPCARKIWYKYNGYPEEKSPWSDVGNMAADCGHYAEFETAVRLRSVPGIELHTLNERGDQYGFEAINGKFKGHVDGLIRGLIQAPKAPHIWEHKDKDHRKFADFQNIKAKFGEKQTLKNWDEVYYAQAQVNMHYFQIDRHYLTVSYAGARKYDSCRTEYNPVDAEMLIDKAFKIINTKNIPDRINDKPDFYLCKFCPFKKECHDG